MKALGEYFKLNTEKILRAAIDAYSKELTYSTEFLASVRAFLKLEVSCDNVLGSDVRKVQQNFYTRFYISSCESYLLRKLRNVDVLVV